MLRRMGWPVVDLGHRRAVKGGVQGTQGEGCWGHPARGGDRGQQRMARPGSLAGRGQAEVAARPRGELFRRRLDLQTIGSVYHDSEEYAFQGPWKWRITELAQLTMSEPLEPQQADRI